ncbi:MAG: ATP-binding protein [Saprospiraceae bacterium]
MLTKPNNNLLKLIEALDVDQEAKHQLVEEVKLMQKNLLFSNFKLSRTLKDKDIVTNILNETINSLEEKSKVLTIQAKELEEQSKFKEQLFANVSHELRTPLHGILGMGHLLDRTPLNITQKGYTDVIKGSADNLLVIINDILSLSEINAGKIKITNNPFSIRKLLSDLKTVLEYRTKKKGLQLLFNLSDDFPDYLCGDRTRVYQIFLNLLNNSIKFTHRGFIRLKGEVVYVDGTETRLQFEIEDSGIGMKQEKLKSIFESFTRVHYERGTVYEGAGLGLNIIKNLLYLLNGAVDVESEENRGSVFKVQIPFQIPDDNVIESLIQHQENTTIPVEWTKLNFLMIEDNTANILYAKDIFESWNLPLDIFPTLEEAEKAMENKYDCILSDVLLPDGNGLDFISNLRKDPTAINYKTPVIILTASATEKGALKAKESNIESYLSKPFPPDFLIKEFHRILEIQTTPNNLENKSQPKKKNRSKELNSRSFENSFLDTLSKRFKGRTSLMVEMAKIFLDQAPIMKSILENSHQEGDYESIRFEAHKFKSTVNIIGLVSLKAFASKTEELYYNGKPEECTAVLLNDFAKQIETDIQKVKLAIEEILQTEAN